MTPFRVRVLKWGIDIQAIDLTIWLLKNGKVTLTDEQERGAFERVAGDLRLEVSDMRGDLRDYFFVTDQTIKFVVTVDILRGPTYWPAWRGEIDIESIAFDETKQMLKFDAFSTVKAFWERAKLKRLDIPTPTNPDPQNTILWYRDPYMSFGGLFWWLTWHVDMQDGGRIFRTIDTLAFNSRMIRTALPSSTYGNEGRIDFVKKETTVEELLRACLLEYNAVLSIDPVYETVKVAPRTVVPASFTDITPFVIADPTEINVTDGLKYDWLLTYQRVIGKAPVFYNWVKQNIQPDPTYRWQLKGQKTYEYRQVGYVNGVARAESDIVAVTTPYVGNGWTGWAIQFALPAFPTGFHSRRLFRKVSGAFMLVAETADNIDGTVVTDQQHGDQEMLRLWNDPNQQPLIAYPTGVTGAFDVYRQYTDEDGWQAEVVDFLNEGQDGKIYDVRPQINFTDGTGHDLPGLDYYWVQSFFAREYLDTDEIFKQSFVDMFRLRRGAKLEVKGLDWYVGQGVVCTFLPNDATPENRYVVKKVELDLIGERATIEVFSI